MRGFVLRRNEKVSNGIRRILKNQFDFALQQLKAPGKHPDRMVHEVRKCFKRIRALLRLVRDETGYSQYRENNVLFRDMGRLISGARDMAVHKKTLEFLLHHPQVNPDRASQRMLREHFEIQYRESLDRLLKEEGLFQQIIDNLQSSYKLPEELYLVNNDFSIMSGGFRRVYSRGRKRLLYARKFPTIENMHALRKSVKYFWHVTQIIHSIWPALFDAMTAQIKITSELLGSEHDLAIFGEYLKENFNSEGQWTPMIRTIGKERLRLHRQIFKNSYMMYAEKPSDYIGRIEKYWYTSRTFSHRTF